ncbi:uncharacterized protein LOC132273882 isoform X4 [Cornus florida]|uniref:uncharacterized protein LOC132273882 isoform X4 n=1 Tax=Cornus florida TaxID=4283 RepID=UPI0028A02DE1|nr:uncharacterized protein LOC132273882 isoform X4 [Cornus florida]
MMNCVGELKMVLRIDIGNCIMQVWNYGSTFHPCKCPLCYRQITLLIPSQASSQLRNNSQVADILGRVETYNRHFGQRSNGLYQRLQDLPFLLRRPLRELMYPQRSLPLVIRAHVYLTFRILCSFENFKAPLILTHGRLELIERR